MEEEMEEEEMEEEAFDGLGPFWPRKAGLLYLRCS